MSGTVCSVFTNVYTSYLHITNVKLCTNTIWCTYVYKGWCICIKTVLKCIEYCNIHTIGKLFSEWGLLPAFIHCCHLTCKISLIFSKGMNITGPHGLYRS